MSWFLNFRIALESLPLNRFRSFLAMLGVVIGVAAVVAVVSIGEANERRIEKEIARLGADFFWLYPNFEGAIVNPATRQGSAEFVATPHELRALQKADLRAIATFCPEIRAVAPIKQLSVIAVFRGKEYQFNCFATTPAFLEVKKLQVIAGRFLHAVDGSAGNRVGVLEYSAGFKKLLASGPILNERLWINDLPFTLVGITESKTESAMAVAEKTLYLPISVLPALGLKDDEFDMIYCQVINRTQLDAAIRHATSVLRSRHEGKNLFVAENARHLFRSAENLTRTATLVTASIAAISLLVGGIGIMNIMLVAVTERTREIGLRRTVGARRRDIAVQFLAEAIVLCLIGGQIGMVGGIVVAQIVAKSLQIEAVFSFTSAMVGILFSIGVGILSGFFPAYKASRLAPIEALHYE